MEKRLLIGSNCIQAIAPNKVIGPKGNGPYAQRTRLGWVIIIGMTGRSNQKDDMCFRVTAEEMKGPVMEPCIRAKEVLVPTYMNNFDAIEKLDSDLKYSYNVVLFIKKMGHGITKEPDGHNSMPLPDNKTQALFILNHLKKRLTRDSKFKEYCVNFMTEIINKGYAEEVKEEDIDNSETI